MPAYLALRLPSPSAIIAVTRVLRLTPSRRARAARREWSDFGTRYRHCPLEVEVLPGFGIGSLNSFIVSNADFSASRPLAMASSGVSPSEMHPGTSGNSIGYPPPSSVASGRMANGESSSSESSLRLPCFDGITGGTTIARGNRPTLAAWRVATPKPRAWQPAEIS